LSCARRMSRPPVQAIPARSSGSQSDAGGGFSSLPSLLFTSNYLERPQYQRLSVTNLSPLTD
jgi:hypothetical protein